MSDMDYDYVDDKVDELAYLIDFIGARVRFRKQYETEHLPRPELIGECGSARRVRAYSGCVLVHFDNIPEPLWVSRHNLTIIEES